MVCFLIWSVVKCYATVDRITHAYPVCRYVRLRSIGQLIAVAERGFEAGAIEVWKVDVDEEEVRDSDYT